MNKKVQFFIIVCVWNFSLWSSSDRPLSLVESIVVGGVVGAGEVVIPGQMLTYAMNCAIKKERFKLSKSYNGFLVNAGAQMPITAVQKAVEAKGSQFMQAMQHDKPLTDVQKSCVSYIAGVSSAIIDTPSNAMQLQKQRSENEAKHFIQLYKELGVRKCFRGFTANAFMKEAPFTVGYQVLAPLGEKIVQSYIDRKDIAAVVGGSCAGVVTAIITQPGAVIRNKMQGDLTQTVYKSTMQTMEKIYQEEGPAGFFRGLPARGTRVACAIPLYAYYTKALKEQIKTFE